MNGQLLTALAEQLTCNTSTKRLICLQAALRGEAGSAESWEALGAAYERIGRLTASLKTYQRAVELDPTRLYALTQVGLRNLFLKQKKSSFCFKQTKWTF